MSVLAIYQLLKNQFKQKSCIQSTAAKIILQVGTKISFITSARAKT